jgi:methyl-accepting chemotaxis protein
MQTIAASVQEVSDVVAEISAASREQAIGIEQVNKAVVQMDEVTQQNAALVEQVAAAATALDHQARELIDAINFFRLGQVTSTDTLPAPRSAPMALGHEGGNEAGPAPRPAPARRPSAATARRDKARPGRVFDHRDDEWTEF